MITKNKTIEKLAGENSFSISYFKKDRTIREMPNAKLKEIDLTKIKNPNINKQGDVYSVHCLNSF